MSEDEDKDGTPRRPDPSRPTTAAARRERRASARRAAEGGDAAPSRSADPAGKRRAPNRPPGRAEDGDTARKGSTEKKGKATPSRDAKADRPSVFVRLARFLREVVAELRKVIWPTRKEMITYTAVVLVFLAVMTAFVYGLDIAFAAGVFAVFG